MLPKLTPIPRGPTIKYLEHSMFPYYKIVIPDTCVYFGYYYSVYCKLENPTIITDGFNVPHYQRNSIQCVYIAVNKDTYKRQVIKDAYICTSSHIFDIDGTEIYTHDIVQIDIPFVTNSSYGVIIFNEYILTFEILFIEDSNVLPLNLVPCKVVGNFGNLRDVAKYLNIKSKEDYNFMEKYIDRINLRGSPILHVVDDFMGTSNADPLYEYKFDPKYKFYAIPTSNGNIELYKERFSNVHTIKTELTNIEKVPNEEFLNISPDYVLSPKEATISLHKTCITLRHAPVHMEVSIGLGDKLFFVEKDSIMATFEYIPDRGSYCAVVFEKIMHRDGLFSGIMPLYKNPIVEVPYTIQEGREIFLIGACNFIEKRGEFQWLTQKELNARRCHNKHYEEIGSPWRI